MQYQTLNTVIGAFTEDWEGNLPSLSRACCSGTIVEEAS
jgi:hypothetical protein